MSKESTVKVKIEKIFYTYHPNFIKDETEPRGYRILDTGTWVVEWDIWISPLGMPKTKQHYTADCLTEDDALHFVSLLRRNEDENSPWGVVKKHDICLSSCIYRRPDLPESTHGCGQTGAETESVD